MMERSAIMTTMGELKLFGMRSAYDEIVTAAHELGADLIIIATHGRSGLSRALLGSTAERVVRHATCPVLTLRRAR